jgi:heme/copper-type cytochrome/quinol oxidase subunit 4
MPFGVKNGPPTYQRAMTKAFHEYIDVFMKIFLDDLQFLVTYQHTLRSSRNVFSSGESLILALTQTSVHLWYFKELS